MTIQPPIVTYLGHIQAHPSHNDQAWDMVTNQLRHNEAAYKTLPLNGFEKVAIITCVLIPRWTYGGLFLGNKQQMAPWDDILLQFLRETPGVEPQMNRHRITTDRRDVGMGLRQAWWTFITRWVTLGQNEVRQTESTDRQLSTSQYRYLDAVRALGGTAGQRMWRPRRHRPLADGLFDSQSSVEDPEL